MTDLSTIAASLIVGGFEGTDAVPAPFAALLRKGLAGAILFTRNCESPAQVAALNAELCRLAPERDPIRSVDQEGGRVQRIRDPLTVWPPLRAVGAASDEAIARRVGQAIGGELAALGFTWDFAPVLDVDSNPDNPIIGDRSLSRDPEVVSHLGIALAEGLHESGVGSCAKHFPGHGDTLLDSHEDLPRLTHERSLLHDRELVPFAAAARAALPAIMTAHVVFEALDPERPATVSRAALTGLLRGELGFQGLVVSDDTEMKAVADRYEIESIVTEGLLAGVDLFLICHHAEKMERAIAALTREAEQSQAFTTRLEEASQRVAAFRARFARPGFEPDAARIAAVCGSGAHQELARRLAGASQA